jgi:hypothetical protein
MMRVVMSITPEAVLIGLLALAVGLLLLAGVLAWVG